MKDRKAEEMLAQAREALHQEWSGLKSPVIVLTRKEQQRSAALGRALELVDEALATLKSDG